MIPLTGFSELLNDYCATTDLLEERSFNSCTNSLSFLAWHFQLTVRELCFLFLSCWSGQYLAIMSAIYRLNPSPDCSADFNCEKAKTLNFHFIQLGATSTLGPVLYWALVCEQNELAKVFLSAALPNSVYVHIDKQLGKEEWRTTFF